MFLDMPPPILLKNPIFAVRHDAGQSGEGFPPLVVISLRSRCQEEPGQRCL